MKMRFVTHLLILVFFFLSVCAGMADTQSSNTLASLADEFWQWKLQQDLDLRMKRGLKVESFPDVSFHKAQADAVFASSLLHRLQRIDPSQLNQVDQATFGVLDFELRNLVDGAPYYWLRFQVTPYTSPIPVVTRVFTSYRFRNRDDMAEYLALLQKYPEFIENIETSLDGQAQRGIRLPKAEIALVHNFLSSYVRSPEESLFYVGDDRLAPIASAEEREKFREKVAGIIKEQINPRLQVLIDDLSGNYLARAPDAVGLWQYPNGKRFYEYLVKFHTTLELSPIEVHRIGLAVVADTDAKMDQVRARLGYAGRKEEFARFIKTDPRFFPQTPEQMADKMTGAIARIQPKLNLLFSHMPQAPYGIERLPASLEGAQTFGIYHQPSATEPRGIYYFNGSDLKHRTLINADALIYHELLPGHHLQMNLQREDQSLPEFRRYGYYTAYSEGWGCYATELADELGLYGNLYDYYGYLAMNQFYSVRLVVDTGMNYLGWSRERASQFMRDHLIETDAQISTETLRYSVDYPGQALAYRIGAREFQQLRDRAHRALGAKFDIRQFHDWVLTPASVPLPVLEHYVNDEIKRASSTPSNRMARSTQSGSGE